MMSNIFRAVVSKKHAENSTIFTVRRPWRGGRLTRPLRFLQDRSELREHQINEVQPWTDYDDDLHWQVTAPYGTLNCTLLDGGECCTKNLEIASAPPDATILEGGLANLALAKKVTISKKSAIFVLSPWNLVKITKSWGSHFDQVSWG